MRARPALLIAAVFGAAAALTLFVVGQLPLEGEVSPLPAFAEPPSLPGLSPELVPAATEADGALELRVTAGGEPQAGAEVRAYLAAGPGEAAPPWRRAGTARTSATGLARLPARTGAYLVAVRAPGLAPARLHLTRAPGEEATRADVALEPPAALAGAVSDPGGAPVPGATLLFLPAAGEPGAAAPGAPPEETPAVQTGEDGTFQVGGLSPGLHALAVEAPGRHPLRLPRLAVPHDGPLALVLERLGALQGLVAQADGRPAAGAVVVAASRDHAARAVADAEGRFALPLPAGGYRLVASLGDRAAASGPLAVKAGEAASTRLALGPAAAIEGTVTEAGSGRPVAGATVAVALHETGERLASVTSDGAGRFRVAGLAATAHDVRAEAPGLSPGRALALTLAKGGRFPLRLALEATGEVAGRVTDGAGRPVAGVRITAVTPGDRLSAPAAREVRTDFEGRFRAPGLPAGRAELLLRQEGVLLGLSREVGILPGSAAEVELVLPEPGFLAGRVARGGRRPPAGTAVVAVPTRGGAGTAAVARALADASGNYQLALPAGDYRVYAAPAEEARAELRAAPVFARVEAGRTTRVDLAAAGPAAAGLEILVLEPGGAPSPGAEVTFGRPGEPAVALALAAGDDGRVALAAEMGLGGREAAVSARNGGRAGAWTGVLPERGTVEVRLSPAGAVEGLVRARGPSVSAFTLEVASRPGAGAWRTLDVHRFAGDRFALGDLPAEPLRIVVRADDGRRGEAEVSLAAGETRPVEIAVR